MFVFGTIICQSHGNPWVCPLGSVKYSQYFSISNHCGIISSTACGLLLTRPGSKVPISMFAVLTASQRRAMKHVDPRSMFGGVSASITHLVTFTGVAVSRDRTLWCSYTRKIVLLINQQYLLGNILIDM